MFLITEPALSIGDIAHEIHPSASSNKLLSTLVGAWWLGEFRGDSIHSRLQLLKIMFSSKYRDDLGIVFIVSDDPGPAGVELPDGSLEIDVRPQIRVPSSDIDTWDEAACRDAFHALAEATKRSSIDIYRGFAVFLASIKLTYEEFNTWRAKRGYPKLKFWRLPLKKSKRGRPAEYNWVGVKERLRTYVSKYGAVRTGHELLQKSFACELHPKNRMPSDKTIREAIATHALAATAGLDPGK
jgi:hypothetical protein